MKKYTAEIHRTEYKVARVTLVAADDDEAEDKAEHIRQTQYLDWSTSDADEDIFSITEVRDD